MQTPKTLRALLTLLALLVLPLILAQCSAMPTKQAADAPPILRSRVEVRGLSKDEAEKRKQMIGRMDYTLAFDLSGSETDFSGETTLDFEWLATTNPLTIDFVDGQLDDVQVNGQPLASPQYNKLFLTIAPAALHPGHNTITIRYHHPYNHSGVGLHRFKDPIDGKSYLFTHFEPYDANLLFPCLDQPDLKATYQATVTAPADWTVVSATREDKIKTTGPLKTWHFPRSAKFSTYLFSLVAGPYTIWTSQAGKVPLRLLARQSLAKYVRHDEWFRITQQGMKFYQNYFNYPYPFKKYDQVLVPDFNAGAMENVANVTFTERTAFRSVPTVTQREALANVTLHEMAHMWFGDLVTTQWWNALWLNESFATYMAALALHEATEFQQSWHSFYSGSKQSAYWEDSLVTKHPIDTEVADTESAFVNFDGITYGKGASSLKQLAYFVGATEFRNGVRGYLKNHAFDNGRLADFLGAVEQAAHKDLSQWSKEWLKTAGTNGVKAEFECTDGKISALTLVQTPAEGEPLLRTHRTEVALFRLNISGNLVTRETASVYYSGARTAVPELLGKGCPDLVYPNYNDYDFVKVELDARSLATARKSIAKPEQSLMREMLWTSLWDMVREGKWPVTEYAELALTGLATETDLKVLASVLGKVAARDGTGQAVGRYLPNEKQVTEFYGRLEPFIWEQLKKAARGSDQQKVWFDNYVRAAGSDADLTTLERMLSGVLAVPGLIIDQDRRWDIIVKLSTYNRPGARELGVAELKTDPSDKGRKASIAADATQPDLETKTRWYQSFLEPKLAFPVSQLKSAMASIFPRHEQQLRELFAEKFFTSLPELAVSRNNTFLTAYASELVPAFCTESSAQALLDYIGKHQSLPPAALKRLRVAAQEDARCVRIQSMARAL